MQKKEQNTKGTSMDKKKTNIKKKFCCKSLPEILSKGRFFFLIWSHKNYSFDRFHFYPLSLLIYQVLSFSFILYLYLENKYGTKK